MGEITINRVIFGGRLGVSTNSEKIIIDITRASIQSKLNLKIYYQTQLSECFKCNILPHKSLKCLTNNSQHFWGTFEMIHIE